MFFFKNKMRGMGCGPRFGRHGCGRFGAISPEQRAEWRARMVDRVSDKLRLNAEQKPLLAALMEQMAAQRQAMVGPHTDMRAELRSWFAGSQFDAARAQALINDKAAALQNHSPAVLAALSAFYDSLNPAQQEKVRKLMEGPRWFRRG